MQREGKVEPERMHARDGPALLLMRWLEISLYLLLMFRFVKDARTASQNTPKIRILCIARVCSFQSKEQKSNLLKFFFSKNILSPPEQLDLDSIHWFLRIAMPQLCFC
jgi:hypothetical protein